MVRIIKNKCKMDRTMLENIPENIINHFYKNGYDLFNIRIRKIVNLSKELNILKNVKEFISYNNKDIENYFAIIISDDGYNHIKIDLKNGSYYDEKTKTMYQLVNDFMVMHN